MSNRIDNATFTKLIWGLSSMDQFAKYGGNIGCVVSDICNATGLEDGDKQDMIPAIKEGLKEMSKNWERNADKDIRGYAEEIGAYWWFNNASSCWTVDKPDWWDKEEEVELTETLHELKFKYTNLLDEINLLEANGSLSKLCNLRDTFDETFDQFFDDKELRVKYGAWNLETDEIDVNICNGELEEVLDSKDLVALIDFYKNYIGHLEDELHGKSDEVFYY